MTIFLLGISPDEEVIIVYLKQILSMNKFLMLLILSLFTVSSCRSDVDYIIKTQYTYTNSTSSRIALIFYDPSGMVIRAIVINPQQSKVENLSDDGPKTGIVKPFANTNGVIAQVLVKFDDVNKCLTYSNNQGLLNYEQYDNYNPSMLNNSENSLVFDIGTEELNSAQDCN